jgi:hypothetical protein
LCPWSFYCLRQKHQLTDLLERPLVAESGPLIQSQGWLKSDRHCQVKSGLLKIKGQIRPLDFQAA